MANANSVKETQETENTKSLGGGTEVFNTFGYMLIGKNILFLTCLFVLSHASAQKISNKDVPLVVKEGLTKKFPGVKSLRWEKEGVNFEAEFHLNGHEMSANFDGNGNCLEVEEELSVNDLPNEAKTYLAKNLAGKKIKEVSKITNANGVITFEAELQQTDYMFDAEGHFLGAERTTE